MVGHRGFRYLSRPLRPKSMYVLELTSMKLA